MVNLPLSHSNRVLDDPAVRIAVNSSPVAYVAVRASSGPHVTPQAFSVADGRVWLLAPAKSLKVRVLQRDARVAILVGQDRNWVRIDGIAEVLAPDEVADYLRAARDVPGLATGISGYLFRNLSTVAGFAVDIAQNSHGVRPWDRVLIRVRATGWRAISAPVGVDHRQLNRNRHAFGADSWTSAIAHLPAHLQYLADRSRPVTVGFDGDNGPAVLPGLWIGQREAVVVNRQGLAGAAARADTPACVTFAESVSCRPSGVRGLVVRGRAQFRNVDDEHDEVVMNADRISWWSGYEASTISTNGAVA